MTTKEVTVVAVTEEAIVAAKAEEAIKDKDKSNHRLIDGSNKDEGFRSDSGSLSSEAPTRFRRQLRRDSGGGSDEVVAASARQWGGGWKIPVNSGFTNKN